MDNWQYTEDIHPRMVELRRNFHRCPELAFEEVQTAKIIIEELERLAIPYDYGGKGSAVIGRLECGDREAPTVALRADMDALPGDEHTGLPFSSENPGKVHACGHDAHMAMLLGAANLLQGNPPNGNVLFVFQPAEEDGRGSRVVLDSGALDGVNAIFGGHVTHQYQVGEIMVEDGVITAQSDFFRIRITGEGGHGARPHETTDAVVVVGILIMALQTLVSRETNPVHPTVVTIGRIQGGSASNVIAADAIMEGTIRTTLPDAREQVLNGLKRMVKAVADLHDASIKLDLWEGCPPVINSSCEADIARRAGEQIAGDTGLVSMDHPSMGAEDFSYYVQKMPGCYVRFGARLSEQEYIPLHSPSFHVNEEVLKVGAAFFDQVVREAFEEYRRDTGS
jgi:amidohydrolase